MRKKLDEGVVNNHMFTSRINKTDYENFLTRCQALGFERSQVFRVLLKKFNKGDILIAKKEML